MKIAFATLIGTIALLLGFFIRSATSPSPASDHDETTPRPIQASTRLPLNKSSRLSLENTLSISDSTQRWLQTVALLEKAEIEDMIGIAQSVGFVDDELGQLIAQRWLELDPQHFFDTTLAELKNQPQGQRTIDCHDFMDFLAKEWPQHDFEAALAAFSQPDPNWHLEDAKDELVSHLSRSDFEKALEIGLRLSTGFSHRFQNSLRRKTADDPTRMAQLLFRHFNTSDGPDNFGWVSGNHFINTLAEVWGKSDPVQALAFANSHDNDQGAHLQNKIVETWLMDDRVAAATWLHEQSEEVQKKHRPTLLKSWATEDPQAALAWWQETGNAIDNRQETGRALFEGAASENVAQAAALIPEITDLNLKWIAVNTVTKKWFAPNSDYKIPTEAIDWLRSLGDSSTGKAVMNRAMENWAKHDPGSMKEFLEEERTFTYPVEAYQKVVTALTERDPIEALDWSASLGDYAESALQTASQIWITKRPEAAIKWLRSSPGKPEAEAALEAILADEVRHPHPYNFLLPMLGAANKAWVEERFSK